MKSILAQRVKVAWLLLAVTLSAAGGILIKLAVIDAPPRNSVIISGDISEVAQVTPTYPVATTADQSKPATGWGLGTPASVAYTPSPAVRDSAALNDSSRVKSPTAEVGPPTTTPAETTVIDERQALNGQVQLLTPGPTVAAAASPEKPPDRNTPLGKVNINTASASELELLPGIGPVLAERIVEFRTAHGPFKSTEELMKVSGIKQGIYGKVRDHVSVGP